MKKVIQGFLCMVLCLVFAVPVFSAENPAKADAAASPGGLIEIQSPAFFDDLPGTQYVYFGRPTSEECVAFETQLQTFLEEEESVVYYLNTDDWEENPRLESILADYHVDGEPMLVKLLYGEFDSAYEFNPDISDTDIRNELDGFMADRYAGLLSVTSKDNFPIQFDSKLHALTCLVMLMNVIYVLLRRTYLIQKEVLSTPFLALVNATLVMVLHGFIARFGFDYAMRFEASPDLSLLGRIGTATWLTVTPVLYGLLLFLCSRIIIKIKHHK